MTSGYLNKPARTEADAVADYLEQAARTVRELGAENQAQRMRTASAVNALQRVTTFLQALAVHQDWDEETTTVSVRSGGRSVHLTLSEVLDQAAAHMGTDKAGGGNG